VRVEIEAEARDGFTKFQVRTVSAAVGEPAGGAGGRTPRTAGTA
jgi:hypothetical protein